MTQYDSGDEVQVKERKTKAQLERERCDEELKQVLATPGGRYLLWRIMDQCKTFSPMAHSDPHVMAIYAGMHDAGLWVYSEIERVDKYILGKMADEAEDRKKI